MSTLNICFHEEIRKILTLFDLKSSLSRAMIFIIKTPSSLSSASPAKILHILVQIL